MALSPSDVNAPHFWRLLNLGVYQGQENDLSKLCGKLKVRASRLNQSIHVNFDEHCVLIGAFGIWVGHGRAVMLGARSSWYVSSSFVSRHASVAFNRAHLYRLPFISELSECFIPASRESPVVTF